MPLLSDPAGALALPPKGQTWDGRQTLSVKGV
jgi:hypothetical protein